MIGNFKLWTLEIIHNALQNFKENPQEKLKKE